MKKSNSAVAVAVVPAAVAVVSKAKAETKRAIVVLFSSALKQAFVTTNFAYMNKTEAQLVEFAKVDLKNKAKCAGLLACETLQAHILSSVEFSNVEAFKAQVCNKLRTEYNVTLCNTVPRTTENANLESVNFSMFETAKAEETEQQTA